MKKKYRPDGELSYQLRRWIDRGQSNSYLQPGKEFAFSQGNVVSTFNLGVSKGGDDEVRIGSARCFGSLFHMEDCEGGFNDDDVSSSRNLRGGRMRTSPKTNRISHSQRVTMSK